jgi:hypothetical protein
VVSQTTSCRYGIGFCTRCSIQYWIQYYDIVSVSSIVRHSIEYSTKYSTIDTVSSAILNTLLVQYRCWYSIEYRTTILQQRKQYYLVSVLPNIQYSIFNMYPTEML